MAVVVMVVAVAVAADAQVAAGTAEAAVGDRGALADRAAHLGAKTQELPIKLACSPRQSCISRYKLYSICEIDEVGLCACA